MAAVDPGGGEGYWLDGVPWEGVATVDTGGESYWVDGLPATWLIPATVAAPTDFPALTLAA